MNDREALVGDLASIPAQLTAAARRAPDPPPGEWSAREVVCHLIAVESEAWQHRLDSLRDSMDEPQWVWTEPGPWDGPGSETLDGALEVFAGRRAETIDRLTRLDEAGWARTGLHPTFGRQQVRDVARTALDHDLEHIAGLALD